MNYTITSSEDMIADFTVNRPECANMIPFNEQLDIGSPKEDLFSGMFIVERLCALHTNITSYQDQVLKYLDALREPEANTYHLYFEESVRSYISILAILAYLDRANYRKPVEVTYTTRDFKDISTRSLRPAGMYAHYKEYCRNKNTEKIRLLLSGEKVAE